jgi:hypothetical protein
MEERGNAYLDLGSKRSGIAVRVDTAADAGQLNVLPKAARSTTLGCRRKRLRYRERKEKGN